MGIGKYYVLTYSMLGYAKKGTKRAMLRRLMACDQEPTMWRLYRLQDDMAEARKNAQEKGIPAYGHEAAAKGELVLSAAASASERAFCCDMFAFDFSQVREAGTYLVQVEFADAGALYSSPFPIMARPYQEQVLLPLSIYNAQARFADKEENKGYYDCNNPFGEAYSHGTFLCGLSNYYLIQRDLLSAEEAEQVYWAACQAYDYVMKLWNPETGEIRYCAPERPGDPSHNSGIHNSLEAIIGLVSFLDAFSGKDPARVNVEALGRVLKTVEYIESVQGQLSHSSSAKPWKLTVLCRLYRAYGQVQLLQEARKEAERVLAMLEQMKALKGWLVSHLEGLWLLNRIDPAFREHPVFKKCQASWRAEAQEVLEQSLFQMPNEDGSLDQESYLGRVVGNYGFYWTLNQAVEDMAKNACFLWELTGDNAFEKIASAALNYVAGCNFGVAKTMVTLDGSDGGPMSCASFIGNSYGSVSIWRDVWGFTMKNDRWASIVNGYTVEDPEKAMAVNGYNAAKRDYIYTDHDWVHGETFIRMDGMMLFAAGLYEQMVNARL